MKNMCKDCANYNGIGFAENAGWCEKKDVPVLYDDKCDDNFKGIYSTNHTSISTNKYTNRNFKIDFNK